MDYDKMAEKVAENLQKKGINLLKAGDIQTLNFALWELSYTFQMKEDKATFIQRVNKCLRNN